MKCKITNCRHYGIYEIVASGQTFTTTYEVPCNKCLHSIVDVDELTEFIGRYINGMTFKDTGEGI